jgi:3-hydroxybutyryl-CoA dehydrogenase
MVIATIGVVGAGTMGGGIAAVTAAAGLSTWLHDVDRAQVDRAIEAAHAFFRRQVEKGRLDEAQAAEAAARLHAAADLEALAPADLVVEAVFEDQALKARLLGQLGPILSRDAIVASNTSCLRITELGRHLVEPGRFLGLHFFSPAQVNPIVEVVEGEATRPATVSAAIGFCERIGKTPLRCRDQYGFAINRFFCPYTNEAARLLDEGTGSTAQIDAVARDTLGVAAGPFQVMNLIKPRINLHAIRNLAPLGAFYAPAGSMVRVGEADAAWPIGEAAPLDAAVEATIRDRLRAAVFLPVLEALDEAVASPVDIDRGARDALKMAKAPCALMDALGPAEVERLVAALAGTHGVAVPRSLGRVGSLVDG